MSLEFWQIYRETLCIFTQLFVVRNVKNSTIFVPLCLCVCRHAKRLPIIVQHLRFSNSVRQLVSILILNDLYQSVVRLVRPMSKIKAYRFHLGQVQFRKIRSLGVSITCGTGDEQWDCLKTFFGLPFLSSTEIDDCFTEVYRVGWLCRYSWFYRLKDLWNVQTQILQRFLRKYKLKLSISISRTTDVCGKDFKRYIL